MSTNVVSAKDIKRDWHLINAKDAILGRLAVEVARYLMGKNKPDFVPYLDMGDYVVVVNAASVRVTGKKEAQKKYYHHSGFPGGMREEKFSEVRAKKPELLIRQAVWGMLPKTKLGKKMIKKLHVFPKNEHTFKDRFKEVEK